MRDEESWQDWRARSDDEAKAEHFAEMDARAGMWEWKEIAKPGEPIVSMITYGDRILVATPNNIFEIRDGKLTTLMFHYIEEPVHK